MKKVIFIFLSLTKVFFCEPLIIGRLAYNSPRQMLIDYKPLLDYLRNYKGLEDIEIELYKSYERLDYEIKNKRLAIAWLGTVFYAMQDLSKVNYKAFLAPEWQNQRFYWGQIFVNSDSNIYSLADLKNTKMAYVSEDSASGYIFPRLLLKNAGIFDSDLEITFLKKHDSVAYAVLAKQFDVGVAYSGVMDQAGLRDQKNQIRILAQTEKILTEPLVIRNDIDNQVKESLKEAFLAEGIIPAIHHISGLTNFFTVSDSDYDPLRRLLNP